MGQFGNQPKRGWGTKLKFRGHGWGNLVINRSVVGAQNLNSGALGWGKVEAWFMSGC